MEKLFIALVVISVSILLAEQLFNHYRLTKIKEIPRRWTREEVDFLMNNLHEISVKSIAKELDRTIFSVYSKINYLGIKLRQ